MIKYSDTHCNIRGCTNPIHKHHMCEVHYNQYVSNPVVKKFCEEYDLLESEKKPLRLIIKRILHFIVHHAFDIPVYLVEHFPLEHIFLGNLIYIRRTSKANPELEDNLLKDFNYEENENYPLLKRILTSKSLADMKIADKGDYLLISEDLPGHKQIFLCVFGIVLSYIALRFSSNYDNVRFIGICFPDILFAGRGLICLVPLILLMVYSGLKIPESYNGLIMRAYNLKLFDEVQDNVDVLKEVEYVKSRNQKLGSYKATLFGAVLGQTCIWLIIFLYFSTINYYTILLFVGLFFIRLSIELIYPIIAPYFPIYEKIKKKRPAISFSHGDSCGGLRDYLKMQLYVFMYNELYICIALSLLNIFTAPWYIYCLFLFFLLKRANQAGWAFIMSLISIVHFYKEKRVLINELRNTDSEYTIDRIENLKRVKLFRLPEILKSVFMVFVIPLCVSILANNTSLMLSFFDKFLHFICYAVQLASF